MTIARGSVAFGPAILALLVMLSAPAALQAQVLDRADAVNALLDAGSGVSIDTSSSNVWSPFVDFGFGSGFEGLVLAGSTVDPYELGEQPFPGPGMTAAVDSYVFWIDDLTDAAFQHEVRLALVDAWVSTPTVANGGIVVSDQGWWPVVTPFGGSPTEYFDSIHARASDFAAAFDNPDGLVAGQTYSPSDIVLPPPPVPSPPGAEESNACALLLRGSTRPHGNDEFDADLRRWEAELMDTYGVPQGRITKANDGAPATEQDLCDAIEAMCELEPDCDKIYIRMSSHGSRGSYVLADGSISAADLCEKFAPIAEKGVQVCMIINGCYTGSLLDPGDWGFPEGSSIITGADADHSSYGGTYDDNGTEFVGSVFPYAMSQCVADTTDTDNDGFTDADANEDGVVDDCEAYDWVFATKPCYEFLGNNTNTYPAGPPAGVTSNKPVQGAQKSVAGRTPTTMNINVCNATGEDKTDFHIVFTGDVRGGVARAWRSNANDKLGARWADGAGETTMTYDKDKNETMVCWEDLADPVADGEYVHFGYYRVKGGLRPIRQYWTPTTSPPADQDKTPTLDTGAKHDPDAGLVIIDVMARGSNSGGWGIPLKTELYLRTSPIPIPLNDLSLGSTSPYSQLSQLFVGSVMLQPDQPVQILIPAPSFLPHSEIVFLETETSWVLNNICYTGLFSLDSNDGTEVWDDPGSSLDGQFGTPYLIGEGTLQPASLLTLTIDNAFPGTLAFLVAGFTPLNAPFKGGTLVPSLEFLLALPIDFNGDLELQALWPGGFPPGFPLLFQAWLPDPGGPAGFAATNALLATTP